MRVVDRLVEYNKPGEVFTLYNVGDIHRGARNHREDVLRRDVRAIERDPSGLWVSTGDITDAIFPNDRRFRAQQVDPRYLEDLENMPRQCTVDTADLLAPIADRCLGIASGNHDTKVSAKHLYDAPRAIADRLGVPYLSTQAIVRLRFKRDRHVETVKVHVSHGAGGGRGAGAAVAYLERMMGFIDADLFVCGHWHRGGSIKKRMVSVSSSGSVKATKRTRAGVSCFGYLDDYVEGHENYVDDMSMPTWDLGMAAIRFSVEPFEVEVLG